jgi:hypothetical protein
MYYIYSNCRNNTWRFTLGKTGQHKLFVVGLNPSTATQEKSDVTVAKVKGVADRNGFDGFVMLNLYPVRATDYNELPNIENREASQENLAKIEQLISVETSQAIWAAWGKGILARSFFKSLCLELFTRLAPHGVVWKHFGPLTKSGHPRHPSRLNYSWHFSDFDVVRYKTILCT